MLSIFSNPFVAIGAAISAAVGAFAMFLVASLWLPFHDAAVTREARKAYVAISVLEGERARAATAEAILSAERKRAAEIEADTARFADALAKANQEMDAASAANESLQNEIEQLQAARPDGVPTVRDLGVKLRN